MVIIENGTGDDILTLYKELGSISDSTIIILDDEPTSPTAHNDEDLMIGTIQSLTEKCNPIILPKTQDIIDYSLFKIFYGRIVNFVFRKDIVHVRIFSAVF